MRRRRFATVPLAAGLALAAVALHCSLRAGEKAPDTGHQAVLIEYFQQPGCPECEKISKLVLPQIEERFRGRYSILSYDIGVKENFLKIAAYQEGLGISGNEPVCMIIDGRKALDGYKKIESCLAESIDERLAELAVGDADGRMPASLQTVKNLDERSLMRLRAERMTLGAVMVAAFVDGFNPCVFSALIFLVSLLSTLKMTGARLLLVGTVYCLACFLCYLAIGFGLLRMLRLCSAFPLLRYYLNMSMVAVLLGLSSVSFWDACRYRRSADPGDILLRLPGRMVRFVHEILRRSLTSRFLVPGVFAAGVVVTVVESVCTGQVYVPTLVLLSQEEGAGGRWLYYLLLYNAVFMIPLLAVFVAAYAGARLPTLLKWSRMDAFAAKIALGLLFIGLAILLFSLTSHP